MTSLSTLAATALVLLCASVAPQDDPFKGLRNKAPEVREAAALALAADSSDKAASALIKAATKDDDLLVSLAAIEALDGREPSSAIEKALVTIALKSPFTQVRRAAAEALGRIDQASARAEFLKKTSGKALIPAIHALAWSTNVAGNPAEIPDKVVRKEVKKLAKGLKSKVADERVLAARGMVAVARGHAEQRVEVLRSLTSGRLDEARDIAIVCAALESAIAAPDAVDLDVLAELLAIEPLTSVIERRMQRAIAAGLALRGAAEQGAFFKDGADVAHAGPRLARIAALPGVDASVAEKALITLLSADDVSTRAAAAKALQRFGKAGAEAAVERLEGESSARVQVQLVELIGHVGEVVRADDDGEEFDGAADPLPAAVALAAMLSDGDSDLVKAAAAVALGRADVSPAVVKALATLAASDADGDLVTTVAVALGRTRSGNALSTLTALAKADSWTTRAAAAEGLKQLSKPECVAPLLALLEDQVPAVRATAHRALLRFSDREGDGVDPETWAAWWSTNAKRARFRTVEEDREIAERYGYGADDSVIYRGLDVIVVPGRGDRIETVLQRLDISFRIARAGQLEEAGLHPEAILLVGCTGEIGAEDIEVIQWYVRAGGALFTSCWALTYTVEPSFPAVLTKYPSPGEVMDDVFAHPTATAEESPYLRGVFDGGVQPYYSLVGAHLIEVLDPERATVLLDSPGAASRHGTGDLAAWFRVGHGVVLDTANHLEEQGFSAAHGLDKPIDRQAFAVNHMGLPPLALREVIDEKWWRSTSKAAKEISDLSVFRILTNFVREKRIKG